jgi:hypothetical protein
MDCKTSPAIAVGAAILKLGTKFDYLGKVLIAVLILSVLPWDFNVIKLPVLEFSEIVAEEV